MVHIKQAAPQLTTNISTLGATSDKDNQFQSVVNAEAMQDTSMARKASDKEDKFMSHSNTQNLTTSSK